MSTLQIAYNGSGHLYDDSSALSLHAKNSEIGAKEVRIKVSRPFTCTVKPDTGNILIGKQFQS